MAAEFPYASRPEDVAKLFKLLPETEVPKGKIDVGISNRSVLLLPPAGKFWIF